MGVQMCNVHWQPHENHGHQHVQMSLNSETDACIYFHELVTDKIMEASSIRHQSFVFQQNTEQHMNGSQSWITPKPFNMRQGRPPKQFFFFYLPFTKGFIEYPVLFSSSSNLDNISFLLFATNYLLKYPLLQNGAAVH